MVLNFRPTELSDSAKRYHCLQKETMPVLTYGTFEYRLPSDLFSFHRFVGFYKNYGATKEIEECKILQNIQAEKVGRNTEKWQGKKEVWKRVSEILRAKEIWEL